jgi:cyanophycinase
MGRLLVFMARILNDGWAPTVRAIAVEEDVAVLLEPDGTAKVVGGPAYFLQASQAPAVCRRKTPLTFANIAVRRLPAGSTFDVATWKAPAGTGDDYSLSVKTGSIAVTPPRPTIY